MNLIKKLVYKFINFFLMIKYQNLRIGSNSRIGISTTFEGYNRIGSNVKFKGHLGYASYIGANCIINAYIGKFCCLGSNIIMINATHPSKKFVSIHPAFYSLAKQCGMTFVNNNKFDEYIYADNEYRYACILGNDVWVGSNVAIMGGVRIGDGSILAANSVITKDVPPYSIVAGVPGKIIKNRFEKKYTDWLLDFKWWDKGVDWIEANSEYFDNIELFYNRLNEH